MFQRYAVYYTPTGAFAAAGAAWLGWDSALGRVVPQPTVAGLDVAALTETPRKYGLHGTIKPPFFLAEGTQARALARKLEALCADLAPLTLEPLELHRLGGFAALTPAGDHSALARLAARVVIELDDFRAPPSAQELDRRRRSDLTDAQERNLATWGYPYVMEEFRFHMTLSGRIKGDDTPVMTALRTQFTPFLQAPFHVDSLTLLGQDDAGMFHEISRFALRG